MSAIKTTNNKPNPLLRPLINCFTGMVDF